METKSWPLITVPKVLRTFFTIALVVFWTSCADDSQNLKGPDADASSGAAKTKLDAPILQCNPTPSLSQLSINLLVTAGASGTPAGFSIQWMTAAEFAANNNTWYTSDDPRLCKASFAGSAKDSRYVLAGGKSIEITVGELLFDNGTSTTCPDALTCGTEYVFRSFAHANSTKEKSDFSSPNVTCSTAPCPTTCPTVPNCTYTIGRWKQQGLIAGNQDEFGNFIIEWPADVEANGLSLGSVNYTKAQLLQILNTPASGNGLLTLAHQLIAAKLNIAKGSDGSAVAQAIADADALIGNKVIPPVGTATVKPGVTSGLVTILAQYNEGVIGPGHCCE